METDSVFFFYKIAVLIFAMALEKGALYWILKRHLNKLNLMKN